MYGIVIDENGYKKRFVIVSHAVLENGEQIITKDFDIANSMLKPRFNGIEWEETATEEEIRLWKDSQNIGTIAETTEEKLENLITQVDNMDAIIAELLMMEVK